MTSEATLNQMAAADPGVSVWLHANAGSGKTKVLIDRVARLLLAGVEPQQVLCLTYTKAAAAEMQNRLFARLGEWAMMPDAALVVALGALGPMAEGEVPDMARARQLFARAIETPGGLRIQTIHSFCATLLRRFPLEAGVSPHFTELDDRTARLMRADIAEEIASGPQAASVDRLARAHVGDDLDGLLAQIAKVRGAMEPFLDDAGAKALFGLRADDSAAAVKADVLLGNEAEIFATLLPALAASSTNDIKAGEKLSAIRLTDAGLQKLEELEDVFLFGAKTTTATPFSAKIDSFPTKPIRGKLANLMPQINDLMGRVEAGRVRRIALAAAEKTAALHDFARHFLPAYAARKAGRGVLDFDDLITRARALLTDPSVAQWVLYRLDGGIDHILVDEAQDTSPDQWQVLERLTEAFLEGDTPRDRRRTIFVVGDKKQSIYSFQGADVAAFDDMKGRFRVRLSQVQAELREQDMVHSFRSSPAILRVVDATFDRADTASVGGQMRHVAHFGAMPGRMELWPPIAPTKTEDDPDPTDPVDLTTEEHHAARMGQKVADWIAAALDTGLQVPVRGDVRPARAGDFLVLVQRRSKIFDAIIGACKARGLAIAGADRLMLGQELAVRDVLALLSFLATDMDDLSLAAVLRSPLGGLSEGQLYDLAHGRTGSLWARLVAELQTYPALHAMLEDLRDVTDLLRPHDLIDRALTRHGGRLRLVARLGREAEDAIDELLTQALAYEAAEVPSVTGFLSWLDAGEIEVKRQMETDGGQIRVMTVHGAKGLEAPIVILPDTADRSPRDQDQVFAMADGPVIWGPKTEESPAHVLAERAARRAKRDAENDRLLYVAMTRAQSLLVVGAAGEVKVGGQSWHQQISDGMQRAGAMVQADGVMVLGFGDWPENRRDVVGNVAVEALPAWAVTTAPAPVVVIGPLSPSSLGGAKALAGEAGLQGDVAMARGVLLHALLEHLPLHDVGDWAGIAAALGAGDVLAEATRVIAGHAGLFGPGTLAEVPVTAAVAGRRMLGSIDRLVVTQEAVLAVDFKSNQVIPDRVEQVPEGILRQMGAYAAALAQIYPDRRIETAILWTQTAQLMRLHPDIVSAALLRALSIDVPLPAS